MLAAVPGYSEKFCKKGTHTFPKCDREWPRVVATEIMKLSGVKYIRKFRTFEENVKNHLNILTIKAIIWNYFHF